MKNVAYILNKELKDIAVLVTSNQKDIEGRNKRNEDLALEVKNIEWLITENHKDNESSQKEIDRLIVKRDEIFAALKQLGCEIERQTPLREPDQWLIDWVREGSADDETTSKEKECL